MNYEDMNNHQINKLVARKLGVEWIAVASDGLTINSQSSSVDYCGESSDAWRIVLENNIGIQYFQDQEKWMAFHHNIDGNVLAYDKSGVRAAMICFLKIKDAEQ